MLKGFKQFIMRGNVVDLAVGVLMGAAFGSIVNALVKDILTPMIGALVKVPDFSALSFTLNGSKFPYGDFLNALISFVIISVSAYFFVIIPINRFILRTHLKGPTTKQCPECASTIPLEAKRCPYCTSQIS